MARYGNLLLNTWKDPRAPITTPQKVGLLLLLAPVIVFMTLLTGAMAITLFRDEGASAKWTWGSALVAALLPLATVCLLILFFRLLRFKTEPATGLRLPTFMEVIAYTLLGAAAVVPKGRPFRDLLLGREVDGSALTVMAGLVAAALLCFALNSFRRRAVWPLSGEISASETNVSEASRVEKSEPQLHIPKGSRVLEITQGSKKIYHDLSAEELEHKVRDHIGDRNRCAFVRVWLSDSEWMSLDHLSREETGMMRASEGRAITAASWIGSRDQDLDLAVSILRAYYVGDERWRDEIEWVDFGEAPC